jgi:hypothetical protein
MEYIASIRAAKELDKKAPEMSRMPFKRIALRCDKSKANFLSFVSLAAGFILIESVHTT